MSIKGFTLGVLFWLPVCFAVWYFSSILFVVPFAETLNLLSTSLLPQVISAVEPNGNELRIVLALEVDDYSTGVLRTGEMLFDLNPLIYGYCVPLYTALLLASPGSDGRRLVAWLNAMVILFLVQILCIQAGIFKIVAIDLAAKTHPLLGYRDWGYETVAIIYQLCYLILPGVAPIGLWIIQFRGFVMQLADSQSATDS
jgi:hypothetical protein